MQAAVGNQFGEFEIRQLLGRGGMGEVYEAYQPSLQRHVALKVFPAWMSDDSRSLERFQQEAAVTAQLDHPNIIPIFAFGCEQSRYYFAMKLVRGLSLAELIRRWHRLEQAANRQTAEWEPHEHEETIVSVDENTDAPGVKSVAARLLHPRPSSLSADDMAAMRSVCQSFAEDRFVFAARVGEQVARALAYAHAQGQIHRDVKPSNIMVDKHNQVYLIDFGLTRAIDSEVTHHRCGTPRYMSPEQVNLLELDGRTDVYSLGVALYEIVCGQNPFGDGDDASALAKKIRTGAAQPLKIISPDVPEPLARCIERAMHVDSAYRFHGADEFADELDTFVRSTSGFGVPSTATIAATVKQSFGSKSRSRQLLWGTVAAAVLVAVSLAVIHRLDADQAPEPKSKSAQVALSDASDRKTGGAAGDSVGASTTGRTTPTTDRSATFSNDGPTLQIGAWTKVNLAGVKLLETQDNTGNTWWSHIPERNELRVNALGFTMLRLGETHATQYKLRIGVQQNERGGAGIFLGDHEALLPDGTAGRNFHFIEITHHPSVPEAPLPKAPYTLDRSAGVISYSGGLPQVHTWHGIASTPIQFSSSTVEHTLEVSVGKDGIEDVAWNGSKLPGLTIPRIREQLIETDFYGSDYGYTGNFGTINRRGSTSVFRNAEIMITAPEKRL